MTLTGTIYEPCGCVLYVGHGNACQDDACPCTNPNHHPESFPDDDGWTNPG